MANLTLPDIVRFLLGVGVLLAAARILGGLARRVHQPAMIGEILAGVLLGPTLLGEAFPRAAGFPAPLGIGGAAFRALTTLAVALFLLVAGMETDLAVVRRKARAAFAVGGTGFAVPFVLGFAVAWGAAPALSEAPRAPRLEFALFFATAMGISALPVIAKILMDLRLFRSPFGTVLIAAAVLNDVAGWIVFGTVLTLLRGDEGFGGVERMAASYLGFAAVLLTVGRWGIVRALRALPDGPAGAGGRFALVLGAGLGSAALAETIGVHAAFGAFFAGVAIGDSPAVPAAGRRALERAVFAFFAPLFFASIGLAVDFARCFDLPLVVFVLALATAGKLLGGFAGARLARYPPREAWAFGVGLNARGAMAIILSLMAFKSGMIGWRLYVALVVTSLVTSAASGPLIRRLLPPSRVGPA